jgi:tetratricopeptide (TPR) repeat protein
MSTGAHTAVVIVTILLAGISLAAPPSAGVGIPPEQAGHAETVLTAQAAPAPSPSPLTAPAPRRKPVVSVPTSPAEPGVYRHAGGRFVVRFPADWQVLRSLEDGEVKYAFTPETAKADPRDLTVSLELSLLAPDRASVVAGKDPVSLLEHLMPLVRHGEPGLVRDGPVARARLGNLDAATARFHGTFKQRAGEFTLRVYLAADSRLLFLVALVAPKAEFETVRPTFERILVDSHFGRTPARRLDQSMEARHVVRKHKASVVSITAQTGTDGGTGTGFIISKSGYVLTNHHVIWNEQANKPHAQFFVEWDELLKKPRVPAQLVGYRRKESVRTFYQLWGVDIALLKIPDGDYEPMPLTPLDDVEAGDPVVTLGFPSRGLIEGVSLTVTTGVVTRFNRGPTGEVESLYTDAPFTHGSSGGPCVSLVTGGVIGQNTFGTGVGLEVNGKSLNDLLHYHGVVPINQAMREWPTVTELGLSYGAEELDFLDAYALSRLYMAWGSLDAAEGLAAYSAKRQYQSADAHSQWGSTLLAKALEVLHEQGEDAARKLVPDIVQHFTAALERDPAHEESLTSLAGLHLQLGQLAEATGFADRAIAAAPASHQPYVIRARIALEQKRYDEALRLADRGKAVSHDILPDVYLIAGMTHYAAGSLEAGRADYVKASTIHPSSLDARLGVAQYFVLRQQTDEAIGEFTRILADFPDNPLVYAQMGDHLYSVKRFDQAADYLRRSIARYVTLGETPAEELFVELGSALEQLKKPENAIAVYVAGLSHRPKGTYAHRINLQVGVLHMAARRPGVASAHLRWAQALGTSDELTQVLARFQPTTMSLDDIKTLLKLGYPTGVAIQLIVLSPLDFAVRSEDDVRRLVQVERIPPPLIQAIVLSQEQRRDGKDVKGAAAAAGSGLVGTWMAQGMTPQGMVWGMIVQFTADGQFASQSYVNNALVGATQGTYRIVGESIVGQNAQGLTFTYPYRVEGHALAMNVPDMGGPVRFQRQPDR